MAYQPSWCLMTYQPSCRTEMARFKPIARGIRGFIPFPRTYVQKWTWERDWSTNSLTTTLPSTSLITQPQGLYKYISTDRHAHTHTHLMRVQMRAFTHVHTHIYVHTHTHMYIYIYIYIYTVASKTKGQHFKT